MTPRCAACGTFAAATDRYCEECGRELGVRRIALPPFTGGTSREATTMPVAELNAAGEVPYTGTTMSYDATTKAACDGCGATTFDTDGYCAACGQLGPQRDRFEADLGAVFVITDRGISHARNEDAVSASVVDRAPGVPATVVIAVCDGVSTSEDPQAASGTAVRTGVDACLTALAENKTAEESVMAGLAAAARAVTDVGTPDGRSPSCTYVSAIVQFDPTGGARITVANVGDSRGYWLTPAPDESQRLSVDDSLAQAMVETGLMNEEDAMDAPHAHVLTRWLGADSENKWSANCVQTLHATEPGVLLLCSDGMWNYLPEAPDLARIATPHAPMDAARALVDHALLAGGKDNITVALVPLPFSVPTGETL
ncbi:PP2C family protein-serine/threonine phosphatase [Nocardia jejuensis]|uniref:PP2C family protein-serine/threonine phosphatase n=1 Tax=Nocardia jejuensis TaxID=328049 RepID=UPI000A0177B2|nr:PP2C family serine/threonine-protein phosphatase [Nocardia jejuensis]